jgi:hypothetical protein
MELVYPPSGAGLRYPWMRAELIAYLEELSTPDPRLIWAEQAKEGLVGGIDEVIHFFFDDHDFDETEIGVSLFDQGDVARVQSVRSALDELIRRLPRGSDDQYVKHPLWPQVTASAAAARRGIADR